MASRRPSPSPARARHRWAALLVLWLTPWCAAAETPAYDPAAREELRLCAEAYRRLPAYSDHGTLELSARINGQLRKETSPIRLTFQRPDKIRICTGQMRMIADGHRTIAAVDFTRRYTEAKAIGPISSRRLLDTPIGPAFLGGTPGIPPLIIVSLLTDDDPVATILEDTVGLKLVSREPEIRLLVDQKRGPNILIGLDRRTRHVTTIRLALKPEEHFGRIPQGVSIGEMELTWRSGEIDRAPPPPATFSYRPPADFRRVGSFAEIFSAGRETGALVDRPVPEFALRTIHGDARITKADLSSKVTILLFWATWSPASVQQLRDAMNIVKGRRGPDVILVAISLDDEDQGGAERKVEALLAKIKADPAGDPRIILAADPQNSVGLDLQIKAIPTTLLVDRQGIIRKHIIGHTNDAFSLLEKEVEALARPSDSPTR